MQKHPIELLIEKADRAIVAEDFDTLLDIYTDNAILVIEPERNACGKENWLCSIDNSYGHEIIKS